MNFFDFVKATSEKFIDPICYLSMVTGILLMVCGSKRKGIDILKWAAIGYVAFQFIPTGMSWLKVISQMLRKGTV